MNHPFLKNKYTKCYFSIISHAKNRVLLKDVYQEKHHIIPKSIGGNNTSENLVKLTAREHFICHMLLRKMTSGNDKRLMIFAANAICYVRRNTHLKVSSRTFDLLRKELAKSKTGIPRSKETRRKISESKKGRKMSESTKIAISKGVKLERSSWSLEKKEEISNRLSKILRGKKRTEETKKKISNSSKGRTQAGAKLWELQSPSGEIFKVFGLAKFCKDQSITWKPLSNSINGIHVTKGASKGWVVLSRSEKWGSKNLDSLLTL